jgi:hypothetical protein
VFCRLDQILLTFGSLAIYYCDIKTTDSANILGATAILESIEKQWAKADQDVFIAAVLLNPFVKASPFSPQVPFLTQAGVLSLMKCLYLRFFSVTETTNELSEHTVTNCDTWTVFSFSLLLFIACTITVGHVTDNLYFCT